MRTVFAFVVLLLSSATAWSWKVGKDYGGVRFALYLYNGYPIWSENDCAEILAKASVASKTVTTADFIDISLTPLQKTKVETAYPGGTWEGSLYKHKSIKAKDVEILLSQ